MTIREDAPFYEAIEEWDNGGELAVVVTPNPSRDEYGVRVMGFGPDEHAEPYVPHIHPDTVPFLDFVHTLTEAALVAEELNE